MSGGAGGMSESTGVSSGAVVGAAGWVSSGVAGSDVSAQAIVASRMIVREKGKMQRFMGLISGWSDDTTLSSAVEYMNIGTSLVQSLPCGF